MLNAFGKLVDLIVLVAVISIPIRATYELGIFGFFFGMGHIFMVLILFVVTMTLVERMSTGKWWFLEPRKWD